MPKAVGRVGDPPLRQISILPAVIARMITGSISIWASDVFVRSLVFSAWSLRPRRLGGEYWVKKIHRKDAENAEAAQRISKPGHYRFFHS